MASRLYGLPFVHALQQRFRARRFAFFLTVLDRVRGAGTLRILDVGGTPAFWESTGLLRRDDVHVTLLNLARFDTSSERLASIAGDARDLSRFGDGAFDIVFSNSVIEHLHTLEDQQRMAREVRRVGRGYFVQTPNYWFPVEPHWLFPCFQFLPRAIRVWLTMHFRLGAFPRASREQATQWVDEVRLLTRREMRRLFPDAEAYDERFLGLTKSITMYRVGR